MALNRKKIPGTTIIEVTTALVIISVVLMLGFMTYANILKSTQFRMKQKAMVIAHEMDHYEEGFEPVIEEVDGLTVEINYEPYETALKLYQKTISVTNSEGKLLYRSDEIVTDAAQR